MKAPWTALRNDPFFRIAIAAVAAISGTLAALSFVLYLTFEPILMDKTVTLVRANLNQLSEATGQTIKAVERTLVQAYFDETLQWFGFSTAPASGELTQGLDQLEKYRFVASEIRSLYFLNRTTDTVYVAADYAASKVQKTPDFYDAGVLAVLQNYQADRPFVPVGRAVPVGDMPERRGQAFEGVSLLFFDAIGPQTAGSVLVANLDQGVFRDRLAKMENDVTGTTLIVGPDLVIATDILDEDRWDRELARLGEISVGTQPGSITATVAGTLSLVTWTAPDKNQWRYVSVVPVSVLVSDLDSLRGRMFGLALAILFVGSLVAGLAAWYLSIPLRKRLEEVQKLEDASREGRAAIRERELRGILTETGEKGLTPPDPDVLAAHDIPLVPHHRCRVVLMRIDGYTALSQELPPSELGRLKAALIDQADRAFAGLGCAAATPMDFDRVALILTCREDEGEDAVHAALVDLQHRAAALGLSVSAAWSDPGETLGYAPLLYRQAVQNSFYRFFTGPGTLVSPLQAAARRRDDYSYPVAKEKLLIESLMLRNAEAAKAYYLEILEYLAGFSQTTVNLGISHLALNLGLALDALTNRWGHQLPVPFDTAVSLGDYESVEDLNRQFFSLFDAVVALMNDHRQNRQSALVASVNKIIAEEYANPNLSLDLIADRLQLTPTHVSKSYRRHALRAIPDVILGLRIQKCRDLLLQTKLSVAEVAEAAGFRNVNYFHTLFRKVEGVTPSEFRRQENRANGPSSI